MLSVDESIKYIIQPSETDIDSSISDLVNSLSNYTIEARLGQYYGKLNANDELITLLSTKYSNQAPIDTGYTLINLTYFRVEFNSEPYLIYDNGSELIKITDASTAYDNLVSGYIIYINNEPIIIRNSFNYYELNDDDISITSVYVPYDSDVTIDYVCNLKITDESIEVNYTTTTYTDVIGQLWGVFKPEVSLVSKIQEKYTLSTDSRIIKVNAINSITIEADPGTIVYVQDSFDNTAYQHIIGKNGVLKLENENATIEELYFGGNNSVEAIINYYCELMEGVY